MNKFYFRPNIFLTAVALIILALFINLGFWQLHRYDEKVQLLDNLEYQIHSTSVQLKNLSPDQHHWQYQPVQFQGQFDNRQQFLLDNRMYQGQVGYEVITPVKASGIDKLVLVDRGWIPAPQQRAVLPDINPVFGSQTIHGIIRLPLGKGLVLKEDSLENMRWPLRLQQADFDLMSGALKEPVYPFLVLLDKDAPNGYVREWQFVNMLPAKHRGYAVQWFAFAIVLIIIYLGLTIKRKMNGDEKNGDSD